MKRQQKVYDIDSIKRAFWKTFHESGEIYFDYLGNAKEKEQSTRVSWQEFVEHLRDEAKNPVLHERTYS